MGCDTAWYCNRLLASLKTYRFNLRGLTLLRNGDNPLQAYTASQPRRSLSESQTSHFKVFFLHLQAIVPLSHLYFFFIYVHIYCISFFFLCLQFYASNFCVPSLSWFFVIISFDISLLTFHINLFRCLAILHPFQFLSARIFSLISCFFVICPCSLIYLYSFLVFASNLFVSFTFVFLFPSPLLVHLPFPLF